MIERAGLAGLLTLALIACGGAAAGPTASATPVSSTPTCPAASAWALHKAWPKSRLVIVPDAGHSIKEPGILSALVQATDDFANL